MSAEGSGPPGAWAARASQPADPETLTALATTDAADLTGPELVDAIIASEKALSLLAGLQMRLMAALTVPFIAGDPTRLAARLARKNCITGDDDPDNVQLFVEDAATCLAASEIAAALRISPVTSGIRVREATTMTTVLTPTLHALQTGQLDRGKARIIAEHCQPLSPENTTNLQNLVLPDAPDLSTSELRELTAEAVLIVDPEGSEERHRAAAARRDLTLRAQPDAMATLSAYLTADAAVKIYQLSDLLATSTAGTPGDTRGIGARRIDALSDIADHLLTNGYLDLADFIGHPVPDSTTPEPPRTPTQTHQDPPENVRTQDTKATHTTNTTGTTTSTTSAVGVTDRADTNPAANDDDTASPADTVGADCAGANPAANGNDTAGPTHPAGSNDIPAPADTVAVTDCAGASPAANDDVAANDDAAGPTHPAGSNDIPRPADTVAVTDCADTNPAANDDPAGPGNPARSIEPGPEVKTATRNLVGSDLPNDAESPELGSLDQQHPDTGAPTTAHTIPPTDEPPGTPIAPSPTPIAQAPVPAATAPVPAATAPVAPPLPDRPAATAAARSRRAFTRQGRRPHLSVTIGLDTLAGLNELPGKLAGFGAIPASLARAIATSAGTITALITDPNTGIATDAGALTYRPTQKLRDQVAALLNTCQFPSCRQPVWRCDIDHREPFDHQHPERGGRTDKENAGPFCRRHHLIKHHTDWQIHVSTERFTLHWTSPTGHHYTTRPRPAATPDIRNRTAHITHTATTIAERLDTLTAFNNASTIGGEPPAPTSTVEELTTALLLRHHLNQPEMHYDTNETAWHESADDQPNNDRNSRPVSREEHWDDTTNGRDDADNRWDGAGDLDDADNRRDGADNRRDGAGDLYDADNRRDGASDLDDADNRRDGATNRREGAYDMDGAIDLDDADLPDEPPF